MIGCYENWWDIYKNRLSHDTEGTVLYRLRSGERFLLGSGLYEARVLNEIWFDHVYEPVDGLRPRIGWNVIDAGAHKGMFAVRAALAGAKVVALEPQAANREALEINLGLNGVTASVEVLDSALWTEAGEATLFNFGEASTDFSLIVGAETEDDADRVPTVTLESLVERLGRVDLLKLDIEGAEDPIIAQAAEETLYCVRRIVADYYDAEDGARAARTVENMTRRLTALGFECTVVESTCIFYAIFRG